MNTDNRITIQNFQGTMIPIRRLSSHKAEVTLGVATTSSSAKFKQTWLLIRVSTSEKVEAGL